MQPWTVAHNESFKHWLGNAYGLICTCSFPRLCVCISIMASCQCAISSMCMFSSLLAGRIHLACAQRGRHPITMQTLPYLFHAGCHVLHQLRRHVHKSLWHSQLLMNGAGLQCWQESMKEKSQNPRLSPGCWLVWCGGIVVTFLLLFFTQLGNGIILWWSQGMSSAHRC